jgi:hypothetical protein
MNKISAKIVADSVNPQGDRITSFILTYPRFIHAECKTHRIISGLHGEIEILEDISINSFREGSKNSASSRAIPFAKMVKSIGEDPFIPIAWQKDHKGMQGTEYITNQEDIDRQVRKWLQGRDAAIVIAKRLNENGVTKQLCNRLLEPFMWHTVLVTATEFENFFELRCPQYKHTYLPDRTFKSKNALATALSMYASDNRDMGAENEAVSLNTTKLLTNTSQAEIHIQALAEAMWDARNESTPKQLQAGQWHIPFGDNMDFSKFDFPDYPTSSKMIKLWNDSKIKIATARCARVSYMTFDGEINYEKDIKLHDHLLESYHMSPLEHCTRAMSNEEYYSFIKGQYPIGKDEWGIINYEHYPFKFKEMFPGELYEFTGPNPRNPDIYGWCNNFKGFIQYRYLIENNL